MYNSLCNQAPATNIPKLKGRWPFKSLQWKLLRVSVEELLFFGLRFQFAGTYLLQVIVTRQRLETLLHDRRRFHRRRGRCLSRRARCSLHHRLGQSRRRRHKCLSIVRCGDLPPRTSRSDSPAKGQTMIRHLENGFAALIIRLTEIEVQARDFSYVPRSAVGFS